ncbi:MAG: alpha/beta hydrolase [Cytophagales bacterium]|nr:alpha/beta hydrolase [Rhizobacter sp.]
MPARLPQLRYRCLLLRQGQRVLVGEAGKQHARTVLLVHGLGNNAHRDWASVVPTLAEQFHVVALDLPGFGASPGSPQVYSFPALGSALTQVLEQTAPGRRVHVVGHSLGGAVSLYFANAHADKVDRLVLVDAAGILFKTVFARHLARVRSPQVGVSVVDRFLRGFDERVNDLSRALFFGLDERFDLARWLVQNPSVRYALLGRYTQVDAALGLVEHDFGAAIRETTAPTTVIWGRNDPVAPLRTAGLLAARLPDARLRVMDGVGHTPMEDSPDAFNRLLLEALASPLSPRHVAEVSGASQGDVICRDAPDQRYSGSFDSITLENCANARIEGARLKQLTLKASSLTIEDSVIESDDVALSAQGSEVTATNLRLRGRVAIRTDNSRFDLAGVSLQASERGVEMPVASRIFFSVSDWRGTDYIGDAHFLWPQPATGR